MKLIFIIIYLAVVYYFMKLSFSNDDTDKQLNYIKGKIRNMNSREFEYFCALLFNMQGYKIKVTKATGDGGKDIILWKDNKTYYVECKHYNANTKISRCIANKLYGVMIADKVHKGIIITSSDFSFECREWCKKTGIIPINYNDIIKMVRSIGIGEVFRSLKGI